MHKKLKAIRLSENNITDQGCAYLQEALKDSYTVEELVRASVKENGRVHSPSRMYPRMRFERKGSKFSRCYSPTTR